MLQAVTGSTKKTSPNCLKANKLTTVFLCMLPACFVGKLQCLVRAGAKYLGVKPAIFLHLCAIPYLPFKHNIYYCWRFSIQYNSRTLSPDWESYTPTNLCYAQNGMHNVGVSGGYAMQNGTALSSTYFLTWNVPFTTLDI